MNSQSFESAMGRLEQIVRSLEQGNVPLEESLKLFREGTELVRSCTKQLDDAQLQIQGRHDPCIVHRAAVVQTCAAALGLLDLLTTCEGTRSQKED